MSRFASRSRFVFRGFLARRGGAFFLPGSLRRAPYLDCFARGVIDNQPAVNQVWFASSNFVRPDGGHRMRPTQMVAVDVSFSATILRTPTLRTGDMYGRFWPHL